MRRIRLLVASLLLGLVAACGGEGAPIDGPVIRYPQTGSSGSMDAQINGVLELDGDCLYVTWDEDGERYPIVWPAGTTWDDEQREVVTADGEPVAPGDEVEGGGGYLDADFVRRSVDEEAGDRAAECVDNTYGEIAVVNNEADGIRPAE